MKLKVIKSFDFAHRGCDVKPYAKGEEIDTDTADPELVKVATDEGWLAKTRTGKEPPPPPPLPADPEPPPAPDQDPQP